MEDRTQLRLVKPIHQRGEGGLCGSTAGQVTAIVGLVEPESTTLARWLYRFTRPQLRCDLSSITFRSEKSSERRYARGYRNRSPRADLVQLATPHGEHPIMDV